jgi:hypothetical protein
MIPAFENLLLPETFTVTTGGEEETYISECKEAFFISVRKSLGMIASRVDIDFGEEYIVHLRDNSIHTNNISHLLTLEGLQPIAEVLDWRNDGNYHVVSFATFPLLPHAEEHIQLVIRELGL